jgi:outer membrane protein with beta-barrel domain
MRTSVLALGLVLALVAGAAQAQRHEVSAFGTWNSLSGSGGTRNHDWDMNYFQLNYGYYFGPQLVGTLGWQRLTKLGDLNFQIIDAGVKYYFGTFKQGQFAPFVEAGVGLADFNGTDPAWRVGLGGSYFVTDSTSVDPTFTYFSVASGDRLNGHIIGLRITTRF